MLKIRKYVGQQHAIEQLQTRDQEQETSLRYLVHELRNAMTVIGGFSSLALRKEDPAKYLGAIKTSAAHVQSLLTDTSLLTRLEKEGGLLPVEAVDVVSIIRDAADMVRDTAVKKRLEIIVMKSTPVFVKANRTAVRQVFVNLLSNAAKYNREGGRVWIFFDDEPGSLTGVSVKDEGCGIRNEELPRVFEKFYRAAGSELVVGAGLGLHIVKLLTEAMGGTITVESCRGSGSTFTASFVRADTEAARPDVLDKEIPNAHF
jgi:signal transduction histidine kinase